MINILAESAKFKATSQRLADQMELILKKGWLSDLEILEICGPVNHEEYTQRIHPKNTPLNELKHETVKTKSSLNSTAQYQY